MLFRSREGEEEVATIAFCCEAQGAPPSTASFEKNYDLVCSVQNVSGGMVLQFDYDRQFLTAETAENWLGYFELFLDDVVKVH